MERYVQQINDNPKFSTAKKRRLLAVEIPEENVLRQLKETQYITKALTTKLREICHEDRVTVTSGAVTSYLREIWGLNRMLQNLNWERYEDNNQVQYIVRETAELLSSKAEADAYEGEGHHILNTIKDWTKRDDHRHHAVDALVIACTKFKAHDDKPAKAFGDLENNPLFLNKEKGIRIRTVSCQSKFKNATPIHQDENGKDKDYVILGNNQVIAIYEDEKGVKRGVGISFWEAVERMSQKLPLIEAEHEKFGKWHMNIMKCDMFLLDLPNNPLPEYIDVTDLKNRRRLSKHLFKVNAMTVLPNGTTTDIMFFHHLETNANSSDYLNKSKTGRLYLAKSMGSLFEKHPIKVYLTNLGKIEKVSA